MRPVLHLLISLGRMALIEDIRKTIRYAGRNGLADTYYAAKERLREKVGASYQYEAPALDTLQAQKEEYLSKAQGAGDAGLPLISILVPMYNPQESFLREMIGSVLAQTYENFEVILADGSPDESAEAIISGYGDPRLRYHHLDRNGGISYNTNLAAGYAAGDYVALLDYDDLLTPDAIREVTQKILLDGPEIIYSDEDKCDAAAEKYFEPNIKPDFNRDYLLTNNYICHFLVMRTALFRALRLRSEFDGAQDYDLMLRAPWSCICHIPKVLYHWRTHSLSTAGNPGSKDYAYESGKRALEEYFRACHISAKVEHSRHRGFYQVTYEPDIFTAREDVGVVGGKIIDARKKIVGGMMTQDGQVLFLGMHVMESGYMHRADTVQDADAVDVRCMQIRPELHTLYQSVFNASYDDHIMQGDALQKVRSIEFCNKAREMGYLIVFDPAMVKQI